MSDKIHSLKIWPKYFEAVQAGRKSFEVRDNDRDFKEGEFVLLEEWDPMARYYTGRKLFFQIGYVLKITGTDVVFSLLHAPARKREELKYDIESLGAKNKFDPLPPDIQPLPSRYAGATHSFIDEASKPMGKAEYLKFHEDCCKKLIEITRAKNSDYTGAGDDPFANFRNVKNCGGASPMQGFLVRMNDKISRISSFVEKGTLEVKDESVKDTLFDLANYSILMAGFIESEKSNGKA